jgi:hypothetical protein
MTLMIVPDCLRFANIDSLLKKLLGLSPLPTISGPFHGK